MVLAEGELFVLVFFLILMFLIPFTISACCEIINKCNDDDDSSQEDGALVNPASDNYGYSTF